MFLNENSKNKFTYFVPPRGFLTPKVLPRVGHSDSIFWLVRNPLVCPFSPLTDPCIIWTNIHAQKYCHHFNSYSPGRLSTCQKILAPFKFFEIFFTPLHICPKNNHSAFQKNSSHVGKIPSSICNFIGFSKVVKMFPPSFENSSPQ